MSPRNSPWSKNEQNWSSSFANQATDLVNFHTFDSILNEERHREFKEMLVHSMFGKFECDNPKCKKKSSKDQRKRSWSSTQCNTNILYRYNSRKKCGEIKIDKEWGQDCQNCNDLAEPEFDLEATEKAMEKIVKRIKMVFYNEGPPANEVSERHSQARERKNPHDSARCEACREGKCPENAPRADRLPKIRRNYDDQYYGRREKIGWSLIVNGDLVHEVRVPVSEVRVPARVPFPEVRFNAHLEGKKHKKKVESPNAPAPAPYDCALCNVTIIGEAQYNAHLEGKKHKKKLENPNSKSENQSTKFQCELCNVEILGEDWYKKHLEGKKHKETLDKTQNVPAQQFRCEICNVEVQNEGQYTSHMEGKKHKKKLERPKTPQQAAPGPAAAQ